MIFTIITLLTGLLLTALQICPATAKKPCGQGALIVKAPGFAVLVSIAMAAPLHAAETGKHLFILSGQSNMTYMNPKASFTPAVEAAFGKQNVIVVKDAHNAQPIRRWYKKWKPAQGDPPKATGDLYDRLMRKVRPAIEGQQIASVTFIWMQGERDARERHGTVYAASLKGLVAQLSADLKRDDVNFVIGRINDHAMSNRSHKHWTLVREQQVKAAEEMPRTAWIDTDDLNGGRNGIHADKAGFVVMGKRFAEKAIALIKGGKTREEAKAKAKAEVNSPTSRSPDPPRAKTATGPGRPAPTQAANLGDEKKALELFNMARQAEQVRQRAAAISFYEQIVKQYPGTSYADRAKKKLERLKK